MLTEKLIVNVALTGMVPRKTDNPSLPTTPAEIAEDVVRCYNAGASLFHIHARDDEGMPIHRDDVYRDIVSRILEKCSDDLILCLSTSGRVSRALGERAQALTLMGDLKPDMASLTLGSCNLATEASVNSPDMIRELATLMHDRGIVPELEAFDVGMIDYSGYLIRKDVLHPPLYYNLFLGSLGTIKATPLNLAVMVSALPAGATWAATGVGRYQFYVNALAITMGGHVRVGLEDAIYMDPEKTRLATNVDLVERVVSVARAVGREAATPREARQLIGLQSHEQRKQASGGMSVDVAEE